MSRVKLFCLPYAGGSSSVYHKWKKYLHADIELVPIELAGRGARINEPLYSSRKEAVIDVFRIISQDIKEVPFLLFGHSMGALMAYELTRMLQTSGLPQPLHVFFSGSGAPHLKEKKEVKYHLLAEEDFKKQVLELGGTPPEFFEHPELMELFLPLLKNDFMMAETQLSGYEVKPLETNITVFLGKKDDLTKEQCEGWRMYSSNHCRLHYFEGGHFFLHEETENIVEMINKTCIYRSMA